MPRAQKLTFPGLPLLRRVATSRAFTAAVWIVVAAEVAGLLYVLTDTLKWLLVPVGV